MPDLGSQELKAICNIIADTNKGLTKTELNIGVQGVQTR